MSGSTSDSGSGDDGGVTGTPCFAATGSDWSLPTEFSGQFTNIADLSSCGGGTDILHSLLDLDGDQKPDLVVVNGCTVDTNIGTTKWRVFRNTGAGFSAGIDWALPTEFMGQFTNVADLSSCGGGTDILHSLQDIDGDRKPDLVVVNGCTVDANIGMTKWRVFRNTGTGFAAGVDWALPAEFMGQFTKTADLASCAGATDILHSLQDLDGDQKPDLVVVNGCTVDANIGKLRWRVFRNSGTGFAAGNDWPLPTEFVGEFGNIADLRSCGTGSDILHSLQDLDGDRRPDLVVINGCAVDATIGMSRWRVFRNSGAAFLAGSDWPLPAEFVGEFTNVADLSSCGMGTDILHTLQDLDGDRRPDLAVVNGCAVDASIGQTSWRIFANSGTGFAQMGKARALPTEFVGQFTNVADLSTCGMGTDILHSLQDLTGDLLPELAVVNGCAVDANLGKTKWRVFSGRCM